MQKQKPIDWERLKKRINPEKFERKTYSTGVKTFDDWTGGLPYGLTILIGEPGCGKSELARHIAMQAKHALYFVCEVREDSPDHEVFPNVDMVDYTVFKPNWKRAVSDLRDYNEHLKPDVIIVDSLTEFLAITDRAMPESELRTALSRIHTGFEGKVPLVGISEVRGGGFNRSAAGGLGVEHKCSMIVEMDAAFVQYNSQAMAYGADLGDTVYTLRVKKKKGGGAKTDVARVVYEKGSPFIRPIVRLKDDGKKGKVWDGV